MSDIVILQLVEHIFVPKINDEKLCFEYIHIYFKFHCKKIKISVNHVLYFQVVIF